MLKAVLFDYGGTLDSDGIPWLDRFYPIYQGAGLRASWEDFRTAFYDSDDRLPERFRLDGLDLERTVQRQVGCVAQRLAPGRADLPQAVVRRFVDSSREQLRRNRPLLERLRRRFLLGIVSNFYGNLEAILEAEGWLELFGVVADSARVGCAKPDREIFAYAARKLGTPLEETLMVGDSLERDMRGAEAVGMPHAWLAGGRAHARPCCPGTPMLRTLLDLEAALPP
ncbi:MAG: HAD-IA family hydrolase [Elusimicrobia bacterium]|nr:HAD-IA family hydrolase [Elusimicrobiota bacterium]